MSLIEDLGDVGQKQAIRLTMADGTTVEGRVDQSVYDPEANLRLELSAAEDGAFERYQVRSRREGDDWTAPEARAHAASDDDWTPLGTVAAVEPLTEHRTNTGDVETRDDAAREE